MTAYLKEFASFEVRTTTGGDLTWTGRETYLEFFKEGELPAPDDTPAAAGLAVRLDRTRDEDAFPTPGVRKASITASGRMLGLSLSHTWGSDGPAEHQCRVRRHGGADRRDRARSA